jgi:hypothetical protein
MKYDEAQTRCPSFRRKNWIGAHITRVKNITLPLLLVYMCLPSATRLMAQSRSDLLEELAYVTVRFPDNWTPLFQYYGLDADHVRNTLGIQIWLRKNDYPKVYDEYSQFESAVGALVFKEGEGGDRVPYHIIYDFSSDLGPGECFGRGEVFRFAVPAGEYYFGFRFKTRPGGSMGLRGERFEGTERLKPGSYDISPVMYGGPEQASNVIYTPPLQVRGQGGNKLAYADFSLLPDDFESNCDDLTGAGWDANPHYKHSLRLLQEGSQLTCTFNISRAPSSATLIVEHLSSSAASCPDGGYSPVTISLNGHNVTVNHSPPSHGMIEEEWQVGRYLKNGTNELRWDAGEFCSHYWLKRWEIISD